MTRFDLVRKLLKIDGYLYSFGFNDHGQLGLGNNTNSNVPTLVTVSDDLKVKAVSCGENHTVVIAGQNLSTKKQ